MILACARSLRNLHHLGPPEGITYPQTRSRFHALLKGGAAPFVLDMPDGFLGHGRRIQFQHQQVASVAVNALDAELRLTGRIAHKNTQAGDLVEILATTARALHHGHTSEGACGLSMLRTTLASSHEMPR